MREGRKSRQRLPFLALELQVEPAVDCAAGAAGVSAMQGASMFQAATQAAGSEVALPMVR